MLIWNGNKKEKSFTSVEIVFNSKDKKKLPVFLLFCAKLHLLKTKPLEDKKSLFSQENNHFYIRLSSNRRITSCKD